jgi:hypothetical protein
MMRLRYADIQNSRIPAKVGVCADSATLLGWANGFQARALVYGRWWGTTQLAQFCVTPSSCGGTCIVLPREVAVIEAANINNVPMSVAGSAWGQFIRPHLSVGQSGSCGSSASMPCTDVQRCGCGCGCGLVPNMEDEGLVPSYGVTASGDYIKLYATNAADNGKKVVVQGNNANGVWVRSSIDGTVQDGEQVTITTAGVLTTNTWAAGAPYSLYKEATSYRVLMFAVDTDGNERAIGEYQASETNPTYRKMRVPWLRCSSGACDNNQTVRAIVSLQHVPITGDNDWLLFTNLAAYSDGILAEKFYEAGDQPQGDAYFFGMPKPSRNARGVLRHAVGMGALSLLESELRKQTADKSVVRMQRDGLYMQGFR